jgi:NAD(P)-dependent dehydrogenase (short-subunit alcohol dehydrogenase family)
MKLDAGQVAVVTGAASGLGLAMAKAFAARGMKVVPADVERRALEEAVAALAATGADALGQPTDVRSRDEVDALAAATLDRFGRVDLICNNAGVSSLGPRAWDVDPEVWRWVLDVNLGGVINGISAFVPHLVAQGSGHVLNTSSMAGISVAPMQAPYSATKHAVVGLSEGLAADLAAVAPGVGVTVLCPGIIDTNIATSDRNRPAGVPGHDLSELGEAAFQELIAWSQTIGGAPISADDAAPEILAAIEADRLYVAPNGSMAGVRSRIDRLVADLEAG